ncbi:S8 family serine peptidase [Tahibacter harae]|uniref:S8 family serine peptidase n=1 Tax=Tahibacter harae TaxID=2963937 RepID=UPI00272E7ECE|nr:S8 family serine peptidase [Tahibacter harae]
MRNFRMNLLAAVIGASVCGLTIQPATAQAPQSATAAATKSYIIEFDEAGLFYSDVGMRQRKVPLDRAEAASATDAGRIDVNTREARDYILQVQMQQQAHLAQIRSAIGRSNLNVTHYYNITLSGISADLTEAEAEAVAQVAGVKAIYETPQLKRDTFRGPTFIGAPAIWNGSAVPSGLGTRGQGQTLASLDGGTNSTHPSFANDASCGFSIATPKLKSALDCTTASTPTGACNGPNPEDVEGGHGVHTSSTAAGNVVTTTIDPTLPVVAPYNSISGVAPCAAIRAYKMCDDTTCGGNATLAAINNFMAAGDVTAVNYSIGPTAGGTSSTNPWSNGSDKEFLAAVQSGIFVAASAGNTSATLTTPGGRVAHQGPWIMTVANSTQDEVMSAGISATGPGTPPANTQGIYLVPGSTTAPLTAQITGDIAMYLPNIEGCTDAVAPNPAVSDSGTPGGGFPAGTFTGKIALIQRGDCNFSVKIDNAIGAGAIGVVIYNNIVNFGTVSMDMSAVTSANAKAWFIEGPSGLALKNFIASSAPNAVPGKIDPVSYGLRQGDVLNSGSLRGPSAGVTDLTKPDITAPGTDILAAKDPANDNYGLMSGTSMSSPHIAGAGMLMKSLHPSWSPAEIKSAMMLTAVSGFRENGTTPWTPDDVGSGRIDLSKAARAGFVMDVANYFPSNTTRPSVADQRAMNFPSMRNTVCSKATGCNWTRIVRGVLPAGNWTATVTNPSPDITLSVAPSTFALSNESIFANGFQSSPSTNTGASTQSLTITAQPGAGAPVSTTTWWYGKVTFTEANNLSPPLTMTVAIKVAN